MKQEENKKRKQKRQTSMITVILWLFLVATMITITFSSIRKNNAVEKSELYDKIYVESATIEERKTGTGPFTTREDGTIPDIPEDGMDYSEDDNYVRTFDTVNYTVSTIMRPNTDVEGVEETSVFYGGTIKVKASIPAVDGQSHFKWVQQAWMQNVSMTDDGRTLYAEYAIADTQKSAPGVQNLNFEMKAEGYVTKEGEQAPKPTFEIYMEGNKEENGESTKDSVVLVDEKELYLTGKAEFNIKLVKGTINYPGEYNGKQGYYMNYGIGIELWKNSDNVSDLRGTEYPCGEVITDIELNYLYRDLSIENSSWNKVEENDPLGYGIANGIEIVAYNLNYESNMGYGTFWPKKERLTSIPWIKRSDWSWFTVSNSGDLQIDKIDNILKVKFNNYKLDGYFQSNDGGITFSHGYFLVGQVEIFAPNYDNNSKIDYDYEIDCKVKRASFSTPTQPNIEIQYEDNIFQDSVINDNNLVWINSKRALTGGSIFLQNFTNKQSSSQACNGYVVTGSDFKYTASASLGGLYSGGMERFVAWRSDVMEIGNYKIYSYDGETFPIASTENMVIKYGIYKNNPSQGITNDELVNKTDFSDFDWYDSKEEAIQVGKITAFYIDDPDLIGYGTMRRVEIEFNVTDKADYLNSNYPIRQKGIAYLDKERTESKKASYTPDYIKTSYGENGEILRGASNFSLGNEILIVPYHASVSNSVTDLTSANKPKTTYDIQEREINFNITPNLSTNTAPKDDDVYVDKVQVVDYLPKGLTYVEGSANKEPVSVTLNEETGITEIVWEYENWQINHE
ncbi:MAG: hypothetical protein Q4D02_08635, partial [Clostridia bacterium]|nr:hypothetical protein [Clostridia bacterium]